MTVPLERVIDATRRFPAIGFRGGDARLRAWVIDPGLDVWDRADG